MRTVWKIIALQLCLLTVAQTQVAKTYLLEAGGVTTFLPHSNSVSDILGLRDTIWLGTDKGLGETMDAGQSFVRFTNVAPFSANGISAIAINDAIIWAATATSF